MKDIEIMDNVDAEIEAFCGEIEDRYSAYEDSEEFGVKLISYLGEIPECKLVYNIMKSEEEPEDN